MPDDRRPEPGQRGATAGRKLGEFVRRARTSARPEAERLAQQVREISETGLPQVRDASRRALEGAGRFAQDHDDEFRQAGLQAARMLASRSVPLPLQPVVAAATDDLARRGSAASKRPPANAEQHREEVPGTPGEDEPLIF